MTFLEGAHIVLRNHGGYMHIDDIIQEVESAGFFQSKAQPRYKNNSLYGTLIKAVRSGDHRFERENNGPYFRAK